MNLSDRIKALPAIKDEAGSECVSRGVVLGLVGAELPDCSISITVRGYEEVACVINALRKARFVVALAAAERQMKRGSGT